MNIILQKVEVPIIGIATLNVTPCYNAIQLVCLIIKNYIRHFDSLFSYAYLLNIFKEPTKKDITYTPFGKKERGRAELSPAHTHFFLIEADKNSKGSYGHEVQYVLYDLMHPPILICYLRFRNALLKYLSKKWNIPLLLLVMGGGYQTFVSVKESLNNDFPVLMFKQPGGNDIASAFDIYPFFFF